MSEQSIGKNAAIHAASSLRARDVVVDVLHGVHYLLLAGACLGVVVTVAWRALPERLRSTMVRSLRLLGPQQRRAASDFDGRGSASLILAAMTMFAAAVIHGLVCPEHFREAVRLGVFFLLLSTWQVALAAALITRAWPRWLIPASVTNLLTIGLWVLSRTGGLPWGLAENERATPVDITASALEVVSVICCFFAATSLSRKTGPASSGRSAT